ncbi:MAG: SAM-dependent methyltransferase [Pseudomonadota bacterium]
MPGTLFLLPTRLGETGDWPGILPAHTRETACRLRHFIVEDAKTARGDLKWLGHPGPLRELAIEALPAAPGAEDFERLLVPLRENQDVGLMSEAGCPGVADPGAALVRRAHALGISVRPLVGPSSLLLALMASGLEGQRFAFHGYLPARDPERGQRIVALERESRQKRQTQLFIETPYRNTAMLDALLTHCQPTTLLCIATELTQPGESILTRSIAAWRQATRSDLNRRPTVYLLLSAD